MSHIRNLFHGPPGQSPLAAVVTVSEEPYAQQAAATSGASRVVPQERTGFPVEHATVTPATRLVYQSNPRSAAADRFRLLRMRLREHWTSGKLKKLLVTSPLAHDGKSTVLMNLATALAERGKRSVLVVEADLHHSTLVSDFKLNTWPGLTDCLQDDSVSPLSCIRRVEPLGVNLLPAGEPRRNPTELLQTPALGVVMQTVAACFDWVLIDSPPVVPLSDAITLQQQSDASLLVVRAGQTPREAVEHAISLLGKPKIVGVVLNEVERRYQPSYQQGYYGAGRFNED